MKEIIEFRINNEYAHLLLKPNEGKKNFSNTIIYITKDDPKFEKIRVLDKQIREKYNKHFFLYSNVKRKYTKNELETALLLRIKINSTFEPAGEECGTMYDETDACEICGANRKQIGALRLKKGSIPNKDIAKTIAGEIVVSEKFVTIFDKRNLKGASFEKVIFNKGVSNYYQLIALFDLDLIEATMAGVNIFDLSENNASVEFTISKSHHIKLDKEVYKCPKGHTIGLNLLSEPYVANSPLIYENDLFVTRQKIGVKRGLLRPEPLYLCSPAFRKMIKEEKLTGLDFEIAHIDF